MDTISTVAGSEEYVDGVDFAGAVSARYLRVYASGGDGAYAVGEVRVLGAPGQRIGLDQDWYSFTLNDYESATLALHHQNPQSASNVRMEIVDANGNLVASDLPGAGEVARVIANFVAHPGLGPSGTFYVRVFGAAPGDYNLVLTRNADFSLENGGDQAIGPSGRVLGAIVGGETDGSGRLSAARPTASCCTSMAAMSSSCGRARRAATRTANSSTASIRVSRCSTSPGVR